MSRTIPFDGPNLYIQQVPERGYDIELTPGEGGWLPQITITPDKSEVKYVFVQSFDDPGKFTPAYVVGSWIWSMPDQIEPKPWMKEAIEWAGFDYDPIPNSERRDTKAPAKRDTSDHKLTQFVE